METTIYHQLLLKSMEVQVALLLPVADHLPRTDSRVERFDFEERLSRRRSGRELRPASKGTMEALGTPIHMYFSYYQ